MKDNEMLELFFKIRKEAEQYRIKVYSIELLDSNRILVKHSPAWYLARNCFEPEVCHICLALWSKTVLQRNREVKQMDIVCAKTDIDLSTLLGVIFKTGEKYKYEIDGERVIVINSDIKVPFSKEMFERDFSPIEV